MNNHKEFSLITLMTEYHNNPYNHKFSHDRINKSIAIAKSNQRQNGHFMMHRFSLNYDTLKANINQ